MDKGRAHRSIWIRTLLVALAVQAVTPDPDDVASSWLFQFVRPILVNAVSPPDHARGRDVLLADRSPDDTGSAPSRDEEQDGSSDEVCPPRMPYSYDVLRQRLGNSLHLKHAWTYPCRQPDRPGSCGSTPPSGTIVRGGALDPLPLPPQLLSSPSSRPIDRPFDASPCAVSGLRQAA